MDLSKIDVNALYISPIAEPIASEKFTKKLLKHTQKRKDIPFSWLVAKF